jgi:uncharacterized protein YtpQ (UPF0354 family)
VSSLDGQLDPDHLVDDFTADLGIAYSYGPPYGERLLTWTELDRMGRTRRAVRRIAFDNLEYAVRWLRVDGQPPALMLSFGGLESSVLLIDEFWAELEQSVPGDLVVGVPARDVVVITGSLSGPGMARVRRTVDGVFLAGDPHPLTRDLLTWRDGTWQLLYPPPPPRRRVTGERPRSAPPPSDPGSYGGRHGSSGPSR